MRKFSTIQPQRNIVKHKPSAYISKIIKYDSQYDNKYDNQYDRVV